MAAVDVANGSTAKGGEGPKGKNAKRRQKKKEQQRAQSSTHAPSSVDATPADAILQTLAPSTIDLTEVATIEDGEGLAEYADVFKRFQVGPSNGTDDVDDAEVDGKGQVIYSDDEQMSESDEEDGENAEMSARRQRKLRRLTVAELKQLVKKPELVDWEDVTASDPQLVVQIKSTRNTVPVPPHWNLKREYLQNKKGIEKPPFQLPPYIAATGITEMKDALKEKEADQTLKAKTRERVQPKMGKVVIDYQRLHDAFFRFQTKPESLTRFGEVYYEGKEYETKFKERKPGDLSDELKEALSIPPLAPPPWLIAMQRFGPPPNYPQLRIAGLNAPIPDGAQWGFHPGGWGRPPMNEFGNPLFGDVMGQSEQSSQQQAALFGEEPDKVPFGELDPEEEEEDEEDDDEEEEEDEVDDREGEDYDRRGLETPADGLQTPGGLETPGGMQSVASTVPGGLETPGFMELRKGGRGGAAQGPAAGLPSRTSDANDASGQPKQLYQVLPEREVSGGRGFFGGDHGYDMSQLQGQQGVAAAATGPALGADDSRGTKRKAGSGAVDVAIDPSELEGLSEAELATRYDMARQQANSISAGSEQESADLAMLREELQRKRAAKEGRRGGR